LAKKTMFLVFGGCRYSTDKLAVSEQMKH